VKEKTVTFIFVLVLLQFSPILTLLFKHSIKCQGVQKFVLEKQSYVFVFGSNEKGADI
jgi:hypothetical protein